MRQVALQQLRIQWREGRLPLAAVTLWLLLGAALACSWLHQRGLTREMATAQTRERQMWLAQDAKNPHLAAHWGLYAFRPRSPWAALDPGIESYTGVAVWVEAHRQNPPEFREADDNGALLRLGDLTPSFVLLTLLPLLTILLSFDAVAGERERGTLRTVLSLGLGWRRLVLGKAVGTCLALGLVILPPLLVGVGAAGFGQMARGLGLLAVYGLYEAIFLGLALTVSAASPTARQALATLVACWFVGVLCGPRLVSEVSAWAYPVPSSEQFAAGLEHALEAGFERRRQEAKQAAGGRSSQGYWLQIEEEHGYRVFDERFGQLQAVHRAQNQLCLRAGLLFPYLAAADLSRALAGSNLEHEWRFQQAVESYRRTMVATMNQALMEHADQAAYQGDQHLWERLPPFAYQLPGAGWALRDSAWGWASLLAWLLAAWLPLAWGREPC